MQKAYPSQACSRPQRNAWRVCPVVDKRLRQRGFHRGTDSEVESLVEVFEVEVADENNNPQICQFKMIHTSQWKRYLG